MAKGFGQRVQLVENGVVKRIGLCSGHGREDEEV